MQKGNPLLKHIRNVRWTFADIVCDYLLGQNSCALYLRFEFFPLSCSYVFVHPAAMKVILIGEHLQKVHSIFEKNAYC